MVPVPAAGTLSVSTGSVGTVSAGVAGRVSTGVAGTAVCTPEAAGTTAPLWTASICSAVNCVNKKPDVCRHCQYCPIAVCASSVPCNGRESLRCGSCLGNLMWTRRQFSLPM